MNLFLKKCFFDKKFKLDDGRLLFKNTISFNYKNIYDDNYVVQGFAISRDYNMVSCYNKFKAKSRVYLYEKNGVFNKYIELNNSNHVGGITYDYINDVVYITGTMGKIEAYNYSEFIAGNLVTYESDIDISRLIAGVVSASTCYFYDNRLYVGTFEGTGKMVIYDLAVKGKKINVLSTEVVDNLPPAIQGICVFEEKNKLYYLFSQSYSKLNSVVKLYDERFKFLGQSKLKEIGLEGIDIDYSGNICGVFENGIDKMKKVHVSDVNSHIKNRLEKKLMLKGVSFQEKLSNIK